MVEGTLKDNRQKWVDADGFQMQELGPVWLDTGERP